MQGEGRDTGRRGEGEGGGALSLSTVGMQAKHTRMLSLLSTGVIGNFTTFVILAANWLEMVKCGVSLDCRPWAVAGE